LPVTESPFVLDVGGDGALMASTEGGVQLVCVLDNEAEITEMGDGGGHCASPTDKTLTASRQTIVFFAATLISI